MTGILHRDLYVNGKQRRKAGSILTPQVVAHKIRLWAEASIGRQNRTEL